MDEFADREKLRSKKRKERESEENAIPATQFFEAPAMVSSLEFRDTIPRPKENHSGQSYVRLSIGRSPGSCLTIGSAWLPAKIPMQWPREPGRRRLWDLRVVCRVLNIRAFRSSAPTARRRAVAICCFKP
jgi:hypothetical protein